MGRLSAQELLDDLPLELDRMRAVLSHGFLLESPVQLADSQVPHLSTPRGALQTVRKFLLDFVDPTIRILIAAFDSAWQSIIASGAKLSDQQRELTRELLAKFITQQAPLTACGRRGPVGSRTPQLKRALSGRVDVKRFQTAPPILVLMSLARVLDMPPMLLARADEVI